MTGEPIHTRGTHEVWHPLEVWIEGPPSGEADDAPNPFLDYRMKVGKIKVDQITTTGANYIAAPCANCKRQIMQLMEHYETGVTTGGVFDLFGKAIVM